MPEILLDSPSRSMSLPRLVAVLLARWKAVVTVMIGVLVLAVVACLVLPAKYTASAVVVVDVKSPDPVSGGFSPGLVLPTYMGTQAEMLQSERVVLQALQSLKVLDSAELRGQWEDDTGGSGDYGSWAASIFAKRLDVRPGKDSNIIDVRYTWTDAAFASAMANAIVQAYLNTSVALQIGPAREYNALFDERTKALRADLDRAQNKLSNYQHENGLVASDDRIDVESARLSDLSTQAISLQAQADESKSRAAQATGGADRTQEVLMNPLVTEIASLLAQQEAQLSQLTARLGDKNPQVQQARATLNQLRSRLDATTARVSASMGINNSVNQSRLIQVKADLAAQQAKVQKLRELRDGGRLLQRDVENAQQAFQLAAARLQQATLTTENNQTNVLVLKQATVPAIPSFPKWPLVIIVAELVGGLLGVAWALARESMDTRLRIDTDIASLGHPLLSVLPDHHRADRKLARGGLMGRLADLRPKRLPA